MTIIDQLHADFSAIVQRLPNDEISLRNVAEEIFRKGLLLAAASYFEKQIVTVIQDLVRTWGNDTTALNEFVRIKALERQYHTLFDWERSNANKFFGLFGDDFKAFMTVKCRDDGHLGDAIKAFLELGRERNRLVHLDFGSFALEKTAEEIYELYRRAKSFVDVLAACFAEFNPNLRVAAESSSVSGPTAMSAANGTSSPPAK